jgi:hypothetical protein
VTELSRTWVEWHRDYDDPRSLLSRRGELVPGHLRAELGHAPAVNIRLISLCAGRGRDVIGVLARHPHRDDVRARLVELDERNWAPTPAQHLLAVENELNNRPGASSTTARQQNYSPRSRRYGTRLSTLARGRPVRRCPGTR